MFSRKHRLARTKDIKKVLTRGKAFFNSSFSVKFIKTGLPNSRFTVIVSTKTAKKAVARNRLKRIIREFIRLRTEVVPTGDYTVIIKPQAAQKEERVILKEFSDLLRKIF